MGALPPRPGLRHAAPRFRKHLPRLPTARAAGAYQLRAVGPDGEAKLCSASLPFRPLQAGYYAAFAVWVFLFFLVFAVLSCTQGLLVRSPPLKADGSSAPEPVYADDPSVNGAASPATDGKRGPESLGSQVELIPVVV